MTVSGPSAWRCIIGGMSRYSIQGPLTYELAQKDSPIRRFFDDRLAPGLKDVQAAYRRAVLDRNTSVIPAGISPSQRGPTTA